MFSARLREVFFLVIIPICLYWVYAGIYDEAPSDFLNHAERFQVQSMLLDQGFFTKKMINYPLSDSSEWSILKIFSTQGLYWYTLVALLAKLCGIQIQNAFKQIALFTTLSFCAAYYFFVLLLIAKLRIRKKIKVLIAGGSVWLFVMTTGVSVFSFIRYYAMAPAMLNFVILFSAILSSLRWFQEARFFDKELFLLPISGLAMYLIHNQEAIFLFFILLAIAFVSFIRNCIKICTKRQSVLMYQRQLIKALLALIILVIIWIGLFIVVRKLYPEDWQKSGFILPFIPIPSEPVHIILKKIPIYAPQNEWLALLAYQGLYMANQVFGLFGILVLLCSLCFIRKIYSITYLAAGVFFPFLTNLNPITLDMFIRMATDDIALYRFFYVVPIPIIGALVMCYLAWSIIKERSIVLKIICAGMLLLLIRTIFPMDNQYIDARNSKLFTLQRLQKKNTVMFWQDIYKFVNERWQNYEAIVSDPFTVRLLRAFQNKGNQYIIPASFYGGVLPLEKEVGDRLHSNRLVIVNLRDGEATHHSGIACHWDDDAVRVSRFYPYGIINYFAGLTNAFKMLYESNNVFVFEQMREVKW